MTTSRTKLTYYYGVLWRTDMLADGTRAVRPLRMDGMPIPGARTCYYRKPVHGHVHG